MQPVIISDRIVGHALEILDKGNDKFALIDFFPGPNSLYVFDKKLYDHGFIYDINIDLNLMTYTVFEFSKQPNRPKYFLTSFEGKLR